MDDYGYRGACLSLIYRLESLSRGKEYMVDFLLTMRKL